MRFLPIELYELDIFEFVYLNDMLILCIFLLISMSFFRYERKC